MSEPEQFTAMIPVSDELAEDQESLACMDHVAVEEWYAELARQGGTAAGGEPRVTHEPNPGYGLVAVDSQGVPMRREDGEPVIDHDKLFIYVKGWATTRRGKP